MKSIYEQDIEYIAAQKIDWDVLSHTEILVTGATGLIGSLLVKMLYSISNEKKLNIRIYANVRSMDKAGEIYDKKIMHNVRFIIGDIKDNSVFAGLEPDYIVHCAAITKSMDMINNPVDNIDVAVTGTKNILELAKRCNIKKCVYISSMEIYGEIQAESNRRNTEDMLGNVDISSARSCYPEGKRMCECMCNAYFHQYGTKVCSARLAQTFGAGVPSGDTRVFAQFARSVIKGEDIVLHTMGTSYGNYCYTADAIYAIIVLLLSGEPGEAYNVVNECTTMTIAAMAELVANKVANDTISVKYPESESDALSTYGYAKATGLRLSAEKLEKLGWKPEYNLETMYKRMIGEWTDAYR